MTSSRTWNACNPFPGPFGYPFPSECLGTALICLVGLLARYLVNFIVWHFFTSLYFLRFLIVQMRTIQCILLREGNIITLKKHSCSVFFFLDRKIKQENTRRNSRIKILAFLECTYRACLLSVFLSFLYIASPVAVTVRKLRERE